MTGSLFPATLIASDVRTKTSENPGPPSHRGRVTSLHPTRRRSSSRARGRSGRPAGSSPWRARQRARTRAGWPGAARSRPRIPAATHVATVAESLRRARTRAGDRGTPRRQADDQQRQNPAMQPERPRAHEEDPGAGCHWTWAQSHRVYVPGREECQRPHRATIATPAPTQPTRISTGPIWATSSHMTYAPASRARGRDRRAPSPAPCRCATTDLRLVAEPPPGRVRGQRAGWRDDPRSRFGARGRSTP
jgi:hypothetical protein